MTFLYIDEFEGCPIETQTGEFHSPEVQRYLLSSSFSITPSTTNRDQVVAGISSLKRLALTTTTSSNLRAQVETIPISPVNTLYISFRYEVQHLSGNNEIVRITPVLPTGSIGNVDDVLYSLDDGSLRYNGILSAPGIITANAEYRIEISVNYTTDVVEVRVNNILVLTASTTSAPTTLVQLLRRNDSGAGYPSGSLAFYDDILIADAPIGDATVKNLPLLAATGVPAFTPTGAASNILAVNKTTLDAASFNTSPNTPIAQDLFTIDTTSLVPAATILAVNYKVSNRKSDVGERKLFSIVNDGVNPENKALLPESIVNFSAKKDLILETALDGLAWTKAKLDTTSFGYGVAP